MQSSAINITDKKGLSLAVSILTVSLLVSMLTVRKPHRILDSFRRALTVPSNTWS